MPLIVRLGGAQVRMYPDDHAPPHVHVISAEDEAQVAIETGALMRGSVKAALLAEVRMFLATEREALLLRWTQLNGGRQRP